MRKWALALAAASLVVVGCGGGGGKGGGTNPPNPETGSFVKLPASPGAVNISYLTGAGRAVGDYTAIIRRAVLGDDHGQVETLLNPERALQLNGFTHQIITLNAPTVSSRFFTQFTFEVKQLRVDNGTSTPDIFPADDTLPLVNAVFPASIRALPGRTTSVQVYLDETMFDINAVEPNPIFIQSLFEVANLDDNPVQGIPTLNGFLSDYVMFDLSGISAGERPTMSGTSGQAAKVYFSGDYVALSTGGNNGTFEVLTPLGPINGTFGPIVSLPGPGGSRPPFGTYSLLQADPRDVDPSDPTFPGNEVHQITSLQGSYYQLADVVGGMSTFEVITFPRSQERLVLDSKTGQNVLRELSIQDVVLIRRSGNTITRMYFGEIDFGANQGDPATLKAYPIGQVDDGDAHNEIVGIVSGFKSVNGTAISLNVPDSQRAEAIQKIGSGTFTLSASTDPVYGGPLPVDFPSTGRFLVFRK